MPSERGGTSGPTFVRTDAGAVRTLSGMANEMQDIIPVVPYEDIRAAHDFLVDTLGFTSRGVIEDGDGTVVHGEVRAGERRIWLHATAGGLTTPRLARVGQRRDGRPRR